MLLSDPTRFCLDNNTWNMVSFPLFLCFAFSNAQMKGLSHQITIVSSISVQLPPKKKVIQLSEPSTAAVSDVKIWNYIYMFLS